MGIVSPVETGNGVGLRSRTVGRPVFSAGLVVIVFGLGLLHARVLAPVPVDFVRSEVMVWWSVLAIALIIVGYAVGLPELAPSRLSAMLRGVVTVIAAFLLISTFQALLARPLLPRSSSGLVGVIVPIWSVIAWNLSADAGRRAAIRSRVVVVAERSEDVDALRRDLRAAPELPAVVVGYLSVQEASSVSGRRLVGLVEGERAGIVVMDTAAQASVAVVEQAAELHHRGVRIRTLSLFYEEWLGKLPLSEMVRVSLLFDVGELHRVHYLRLKRVVDLAFAAVGVLALVPLLVIVAALNPVLNRGPLFFRQVRIGKDGAPFIILKLRTMSTGGCGRGEWTTVGDRRVTRLGAVLRRTHLDELPQVFNILRGDLSIVGPRPEQAHHVVRLTEKIPFYELRHLVRPGITGWAQVKQGYAEDDSDALDKLQYDFYYLRRQGLGLDARILWRTIRDVVGAEGR